jgi:hypothetical protein
MFINDEGHPYITVCYSINLYQLYDLILSFERVIQKHNNKVIK